MTTLNYWTGASTWVAAGAAFVVGFTLRAAALHLGWEEPMPKDPAGTCIHSDGRHLLGRKLHKKSQQELRDLGLVVEEPAEPQPAAAAP